MTRLPSLLITLSLTAVAGCTPGAAAFDPDDPAVAATVDSLLATAMAGAAEADADRVLSIANRDALTLVTGDVLLSGYDTLLAAFRNTYENVSHQNQTVTEKRFRMLSPDVALLMAVGEGTWTDQAGFTYEPVGLGLTLVFTRRGGEWRVTHVHQSIIR